MSFDGGRTWDDVDARSLTIPGAVAKVAELAADQGWSWSIGFAPGPPTSVALRFARGTSRAWALWRLDDGCRFVSAGANRLPDGRLRTLASLRTYIADLAA